jgi:hypothetical protein
VRNGREDKVEGLRGKDNVKGERLKGTWQSHFFFIRSLLDSHSKHKHFSNLFRLQNEDSSSRDALAKTITVDIDVDYPIIIKNRLSL